MRPMKLTRAERDIEQALLRGDYVDVPKGEIDSIVQDIAHRRKDAVLNIRVNSEDLRSIKQKAKRYGVKYQSFIAELLHRVAHS